MPPIIVKLSEVDYYIWAISIYLLRTTVATILVGKLSANNARKPFRLVGIALLQLGL